MFILKIDNRIFFVKQKSSLLEACKYVGIKIPRFCYHERLSVAGNCRMCLVEVDRFNKPIASCATPVMHELEIVTNSPFVQKARENILEFLLLNHPLDCPICDQAGECDLQDQYNLYGAKASRFVLNKRGVENKNCGPIIKTIMTRCIHCTRCVRFGVEVCGTTILGTFNRGTQTEIGSYVSKVLYSELSGNLVDLCPVGALTSKVSSFKIRPWELSILEGIDLMDGTGSSIYIHLNEFGVVRVLPKKNKNINDTWISDKIRFCFDSLYRFRLKTKIINPLNKHIKNKFLSLKEKSLFLISNEADSLTLRLLKHLSYVSGNKITVQVISNNQCDTNFYLWGQNTKLQELNFTNSKICFIFSTNIRFESVALNTKLRAQFLSSNLNFYGLGFYTKGTFPISFFKLNILDFFLILKQKNIYFSKIILKYKHSIFIFGNSLKNRIRTFNLYFKLLKKKIPSLLIYFLQNYCNSEAISFYNYNFLNSNSLKKKDLLYLLQADDTIQSRRILLKRGTTTILGTSHTFPVMTWSDFIFPMLNLYETEGVFLNLEQRSQFSQKIPSINLGENLSATSFIKSLCDLYSSNNTNFIIDKLQTTTEVLVESAACANHVKFIKASLASYGNATTFIAFSFFFSLYPQKAIIEDFYRTNLSSKVSLTLLNCSRSTRTKECNF
jgi:NADH-quinone oxidoreductase chain G